MSRRSHGRVPSSLPVKPPQHIKLHLCEHHEHVQVFMRHAILRSGWEIEHHPQKQEPPGYARSRSVCTSHCELLPPTPDSVGFGHRHPLDPSTRPWGQQAFPETAGFREFLHQLLSLQSIDLVHCDFNCVRSLNSIAVDLPFFCWLTIYVAPETRSILTCFLTSQNQDRRYVGLWRRSSSCSALRHESCSWSQRWIA